VTFRFTPDSVTSPTTTRETLPPETGTFQGSDPAGKTDMNDAKLYRGKHVGTVSVTVSRYSIDIKNDMVSFRTLKIMAQTQ
jgi:hypothetical protein